MSLESEAAKVKMITSVGTFPDRAEMSYAILKKCNSFRLTFLCTCNFKISLRNVCIVTKSD